MKHDTRVQNPCAKLAWKIPSEYDEMKQDDVKQHLASLKQLCLLDVSCSGYS